MGQRHQAFAIARVAPHNSTTPRYRCIAAWHHQWCYGKLPLQATRRVLTLIKQKDNAEIIRAEIENMQGKYGVWGEQPYMPCVPCPYTMLLLATSWCVDLDPASYYASGVSLRNNILSADMGSGEGDNNDGITVIDVTDPESPAYCFVSVDGIEVSKQPPKRVPLSAEKYLRAYYPRPTSKQLKDERRQVGEQWNLDTIATLSGEKMVTLEMLAEAWNSEYQPTLDKRNRKSPPSEENQVSATIPSLVDLTLPPSVTMALKTGDITQLEHILCLPDKLTLIHSILRDISPFPDSGMPLLEKIVAQEMKSGNTTTVNLSRLALSNSQIIQTASSFTAEMKSLNLSYNTIATIDTVRQVLTSFPGLTRLVLLECDGITDDDLKELLSSSPKLFYNLEALIHPFLLSGYFPFPNAFSYIGVLKDSQMVTSCSLAYFSPSSVVQALTDLLQYYTDEGVRLLGVQATALAPQAAFSSSARHSEQINWGQRNVVAFPMTSHGALEGEGWAFVLNYGTFQLGQRNLWGFVRRVSDEKQEGSKAPLLARMSRLLPKSSAKAPPPFEILNLRSFLTRMADEGRPVVAEEAIKRLEELLKKFEEVNEASLVTADDMPLFISNVDKMVRMAYYARNVVFPSFS